MRVTPSHLSLLLLTKKSHEILKHGITSSVNPAKRYTKKFMQDKWMVILDQGSRLDMRAKESFMNFAIPGKLNRERTKVETVGKLLGASSMHW